MAEIVTSSPTLVEADTRATCWPTCRSGVPLTESEVEPVPAAAVSVMGADAPAA